MSRKFKIGGSEKSLRQWWADKIAAEKAKNEADREDGWKDEISAGNDAADDFKEAVFKINKKGEMVPVTGNVTLGADDIKVAGSKSSLRRIADLERNVVVLANRIATIDNESDVASGSEDDFDNWITETTAFTKDVTLGRSGSTSWWGGSTTSRVDVDGHLYVNNGMTLGSTATEVFRDLVGGMVSGSETGISVTHNDSGNTLSFSVTSAPKWSTARTLSLTGDVSGSVSWDGSGNASITTTVANDSHNHDGRYYTETEADARFATPADITTAINNLVDGAPTALNTLNELAAALADNASFSTTVTNSIATKLPLAGGTMSGNINMGGYSITNAGTFNGTATSAKYADLAERYAADAPYSEGTVVVFGGEAEVTASTSYAQRSIAGVVSTKPAVMMNAEAGNSQTHPFIALQGRVPVKVTGEVKKGDILVASDIAGTATAWDNDNADPRMTAYVGIAIADAVDGFVEVKVGK
jgi:hypothetical protein